jgi:uncharacterized membrane-anchored protein
VFHFAFVTGAEEAAADRRALHAFCQERGREGPEADAKHFRIDLDGMALRWESHSEFTTYTWEFAANGVEAPVPFQPTADRMPACMRRLSQPGPLLVAVDLHLLPNDLSLSEIQAVFSKEQIAVAEAEGGAALAASDFEPDSSGFVRMLVLGRHLSSIQAGALVQRLLEIETYRAFALLGLFEAQALSPVIRRIEIALPQLLQEMQRSEGFEANHGLLDRLTALAAELEAGAAGSLYRFGATRAYDELVSLRLSAIHERPAPGFPSWSEFLSRRLNPAMRTCASTEERQANLSRKLARAAQLLRARVDVDLEQQNRTLLETMNERARTQLRLQQTVEGLSVAAISYYVASLAHILFEAAHSAGVHVNPTIATGAIVPLAVIAVAWTVRRIRRGHSAD